LGLGYPGGPLIDKIARDGDKKSVDFPRSMLEKDSFDFSFSGLKSAVLNYQNRMAMKNIEYKVEDVAASFQEAVIDVLVSKTVSAAKKYGIKKVTMAGGVASNSRLREVMNQASADNGFDFSYPPGILCTDNGAMIGCAAYYKYLKGEFSDSTLNAYPNLKIN